MVTVSGGIDSVVLAYLFYKSEADFVIAHCNFGLRGEESDHDEVFVKGLAKKMGVSFYSRKFEAASYANIKGISIQMAARELRYKWFEELREETKSDQIATAHHKGDTVETILFNLAKGTGLEGFHGISPKSNGLVRPLLFAKRKEIEAYAKANKVKWREDSSNTSQKYARNKIRHSIVPVLEEINPQAQEAINSTALRIRETEDFLNHHIEVLRRQIVTREGQNLFIKADTLIRLPGYRYVLLELLKPYSFTYQQVMLIANNLHGMSGKLFYSNTHVVNLDRTHLIISPIEKTLESFFISEKEDTYSFGNQALQTKVYNGNGYKIRNEAAVLALDINLLEFPLQVRVWQKGDVFRPLGMKGKKKLSDFMIDAKIPVNLKNNVWVVVSGDAIAGVLNHRLDERFKITKRTSKVFEITCR